MYTNNIVRDKNLIILAGGTLIILLVVGILSMLVLGRSSKSRVGQGGSYSFPSVNQVSESDMNILLVAQNNSNESGIANLRDTSGLVTVTINLTGFTPNIVQPAHIHMGDCPGVGEVKYPLSSVINGKSVTVLNVSLAQLKQQLPLAVNVHKSVSEVSTYTSCGTVQ